MFCFLRVGPQIGTHDTCSSVYNPGKEPLFSQASPCSHISEVLSISLLTRLPDTCSLLCCQAEEPTGGKRAHFNTREFAKKYNLGDPVSVVYFNSHKV